MSEPQQHIVIREAEPAEFATIGALTVETYLALDGMPPRQALPAYYAQLEDVEGRAALPSVTILTATSAEGELLGGVTFVLDLAHYGAPIASYPDRAAGFRMLAVSSTAQGRGTGRALTLECLRRAREARKQHVLLHTTALMKAAQHIYTKLGFRRFPELDFAARGIAIEGFLLDL